VKSNLQYAQKNELSVKYAHNNKSDKKYPRNDTKQNLPVPSTKSVKVESSTDLVQDIFLPTTVSNVVDMRNIWNERRILKKKVCERSVSRHFATIHRQVYYMPSYKLLWCPVFKASSSNWIWNMLALSKLSPGEKKKLERKYRQQPNQQARAVVPSISKSKLDSIELDDLSFRMLIVRHPFNR